MAKIRCGRLLLLLLLAAAMFALAACGEKEEEIKKIKDLDFTVVEEADLPEELLAKIEEKKAQPFKLTYATTEYLYIVQGYGEKPSGGYSIAVNELFLAENAICFQSELIGPAADEAVTQALTHPYIAVKIKFVDKKVVFR